MPTTVLLLDPRDEIRTSHASALHKAGFEVLEIGDPQTALDIVKIRQPGVIVVGLEPETRDVHLNLCREIKSDSRTKEIPIVLTTETLAADDVGLATDPGVLVLTAPQNDSTKLVAAISGVLAAHHLAPVRASLRPSRKAKRSA
jgi:CheY-like chemotaxis protein